MAINKTTMSTGFGICVLVVMVALPLVMPGNACAAGGMMGMGGANGGGYAPPALSGRVTGGDLSNQSYKAANGPASSQCSTPTKTQSKTPPPPPVTDDTTFGGGGCGLLCQRPWQLGAGASSGSSSGPSGGSSGPSGSGSGSYGKGSATPGGMPDLGTLMGGITKAIDDTFKGPPAGAQTPTDGTLKGNTNQTPVANAIGSIPYHSGTDSSSDIKAQLARIAIAGGASAEQATKVAQKIWDGAIAKNPNLTTVKFQITIYDDSKLADVARNWMQNSNGQPVPTGPDKIPCTFDRFGITPQGMTVLNGEKP